MTLGNSVPACFHKNNRLRKVSLVELDMKKYDNSSQRGCLYTLNYYNFISLYRSLERIKMLQYIAYKREAVRNIFSFNILFSVFFSDLITDLHCYMLITCSICCKIDLKPACDAWPLVYAVLSWLYTKIFLVNQVKVVKKL